MKREYVAPMMEIEMMEEELPLCGSISSSSVDVGYGGVTDGSHEPAANIRRDFEEALEGLW